MPRAAGRHLDEDGGRPATGLDSHTLRALYVLLTRYDMALVILQPAIGRRAAIDGLYSANTSTLLAPVRPSHTRSHTT